MSLILKTLASSYPPQTLPTISFLSLDAEALPEVSESYDVTAVPFLVIQRDGKVLEKVSGSDAAKVRAAVERHAGKGGNTGKVGLPPALEVTRREDDGAKDATETKGEGESEGGGGGGGGGLSKYAPGANDPKTAPEMSSMAGQKEELETRLRELVKAAPVMLFMKGTPSAPQCGFSRTIVSMLREQGVRYGFFNIVSRLLLSKSFDVRISIANGMLQLADEEVRSGMKTFSDW